MASSTSKSTSGKPRKRATSRSPNGSSPKPKSSRAKPKSASSAKPKSASRARSTGGANASKQSSRATSKQGSAPENASPLDQAVGTVKQTAAKVGGPVRKVSGPALTVGAAAAGLAGGLLLRGRRRRKTVLGVPVPRSIGRRHLSDFDMKSIAKTVGEASQSFAKTSKTVSQDIERAGDQAERIGKILS
jgi:hypothetical protein